VLYFTVQFSETPAAVQEQLSYILREKRKEYSHPKYRSWKLGDFAVRKDRISRRLRIIAVLIRRRQSGSRTLIGVQ